MAGLSAGSLAVVAVRPEVDPQPQALKSLLVLVDSSASSALAYSAQLDALEKLLTQLPADLELTVACFDQSVAPVYNGKNLSFKIAKLKNRTPLGASDLNGALQWAAAQPAPDRLLILSDGIATMGPERFDVPDKWKRIDVLSLAGARNTEALERLAYGHHGLILDPALPLSNQLRHQASTLDVKIPGAAWLWPGRLQGLQPGEERLIYAEVPGLKQQLQVELGPQKQTLDLHSVAPPLLKRAAARAQIARLSQSLPVARSSSKAAPQSLSKPVTWKGQPLPNQSQAPEAYSGQMRVVELLLSAGDSSGALEQASQWHKQEPADVLALVAMGQCLEANKQPAEAARAYGSIIDLYPARADLRRYAGCLLQNLQAGQALALDTFYQAREQRPDHPASHRLLAYALARQGQYQQAFEVLEQGLARDYPDGRFLGCRRILEEDLGLIGAAWAASQPDQQSKIRGRAARWPQGPSTRFVLTWETDANDVDFHIRDNRSGHAYYQSKELKSGGALYDDVTTGYGPECFAIPGIPQAFPYSLEIQYYSRGPMGYGMGNLEIVQHDGQGHLSFEERPYVVMKDQAFVDLGRFEKPLP